MVRKSKLFIIKQDELWANAHLWYPPLFGKQEVGIWRVQKRFPPATIDGRNLIFGHKLHIGTPYRGKRFWTHQIPTSCLPTLLGPKTLPTIWYTYMMLVTKYQISAINTYWEKCDEKYLGWTEGWTDRRTEVKQYTSPPTPPFGERGDKNFIIIILFSISFTRKRG
jgi:hypothetical protein